MAARLAVGVSLAAMLALGVAVHAAQPVTLPDGPGREIVAERCNLCHDLRYARSTDYGEKGWRNILAQMRNAGLPLTEDEFETVARYLTTVNTERERAPAKLIDGPVRVTFKDWPLSAEGAMPRDAARGPDGAIWFTAQFGNFLIRLDPWTGDVSEYKVRMPYSAPMGLAVDARGNVWFASNRRSYIGRFNRASGLFQEFPMPGETAPDPSGLALDKSGNVWFTSQRGNVVGRLDPASGNFTFVPVPPQTTPFAIVVDAAGTPFVGLRDGHSILRIDPESFTRREFKLAHDESEPRRMAIGADGSIWYTDIDRGYLGRLDPETGAVKEYLSPSGARSAPHGLTTAGNIVWYVESKSLPNTLVRFDPATERFQTFAIPAGYVIVRDIAVTEDGNLAFAMDQVDRIALATIGR